MELRPGYKKTEIGVIPSDWAVAQFNDVTDLITCGIAATPKYVSEVIGYPFLSSTNVKNGRVLWCDYKHIDPQQHRHLYKNNPPRKGDVLYSRVGTIGEAAVIDSEAEFSIYVSLTLIKPNRSLDSNFLAHLLNSAPYKQRARDQVYLGGGVGNLNVDVVRRYPIPIPTVSEQQAIATALSDADALIEALEQLLAKKRQIKQGAMQELLTSQRRLPGFAGEWAESELGRWGQCHRGVSYNPARDLSAHDTDTSVRLLRSNNVQCSQVVLEDIQFVSVDRVSDNQRLRRSDVLICMANGSRDLVGKAAQFAVDDGFAYTFGAFMGAFRPNGNADPTYVFYCFHSDVFRKHIAILLAGSSINNLTPSSIESCVIRAPADKDEQIAIAAVLSDMDAEIATLETKLAKARSVKQGMMQELLTGRIRLV